LQTRKIFREIEASYHADDCSCDDCGDLDINAIDLESYNKVIDQIANDLQSGKLQPSDLSEDLIKQIYADLSTGTTETYGKNWTKFDTKEPNSLIQKFKKNLWQFSSAKTLAELEHINSLLLDKNGKLRSEHDFTQEVRKANIKFNKNYLQAEFQTARRGAQMAEMWRGFVKNADLFPNLQYRTVGDDRVRQEHASLNGIIKPINDDFWNKYYPPNGWRCRCSVTQTAATASEQKVEDKTVLPEFQGNVATDAEIFTSKGSFFKLLNLDYKAKTNAEILKLNAPFDLAYKGKNGKKVLVSIFADESDKLKNIETAMVVVDKLNIDVKIRAHLFLDKFKNPELEILGVIGDATNRNGDVKNFISNSFNNKLNPNGQLFDLGKTFIAMDFKEISTLSRNEYKSIVGSLFHKMKNYDTVEFVVIIFNNEALKIYNKDIPKDLSAGYDYVFKQLLPLRNTKGSK
jgi:SPP1 gp7 family putative phage head morphogenesis protein